MATYGAFSSHDFRQTHQILQVLLLPDFPLDLIIEASDFAVRVLDGFGIHIPTDFRIP